MLRDKNRCKIVISNAVEIEEHKGMYFIYFMYDKKNGRHMFICPTDNSLLILTDWVIQQHNTLTRIGTVHNMYPINLTKYKSYKNLVL